MWNLGVSLTVQDLLRQEARIQNFYFNISEMRLSITSLFSVQIMSYLGASQVIYSDVIGSFISEILKYESSVIQSLTEKHRAVLFTPLATHSSYAG